jgi:hypothetical protein
MRPITNVIIVIVITFGALSHRAIQGQASLTGRVVSDKGQPIAGAKVVYHRKVTYAIAPPGTSEGHAPHWVPTGPQIQGSVITSAGGHFTLPPVPNGNYTLCAASPVPGYLNTCRWSAATPFSVAQGLVPTVPDLVLQTGTEVHVRVNDPLNLAPTASKAPVRLIVGVMTNGNAFYAADVVSQDAAGRDLSVTVPSATPLRLWLYGPKLNVRDSTGATVNPAGHSLPFQAAANASRVDYVFNITGTRQ